MQKKVLGLPTLPLEVGGPHQLLCKGWSSLHLGTDDSVVLHWLELRLQFEEGHTYNSSNTHSVLVPSLGTYLSSSWSLILLLILLSLSGHISSCLFLRIQCP